MRERLYSSRFRWLLLVIAVLINLAWLSFIPNTPISDQAIYHRTAAFISSGYGVIDDSGHPTAYWAPGYMFYLASFYTLFGQSYFVGFCANFLSYLALIYGIYIFAKQLYSEATGWCAALIAAWYPTFIFYTTILASEIFFSALLIWGLIFAYHCLAKKKWPYISAILSGLLFGAAIYVRPQAMVVPFLVFFIGWIHQRSFLSTLFFTCLIFLSGFLILLPWGLRNQQKLGEFVFVSANLGVNLWIGNHPHATGKYMPLSDIVSKDIEYAPLVERNKILMHKSLDFIWHHPVDFIKLSVKRLYLTMRSESIGVIWNMPGIEATLGKKWIMPLKILVNLCYYLLIIAFLCSLYRIDCMRDFRSQDALLLAVMFLLSLPFLFVQAQDRFHVPLIPYLIILAVRPNSQKIKLSGE
jgi:4-amino-4-deoxy-L-arabinose transferase-like glycosyltransferase